LNANVPMSTKPGQLHGVGLDVVVERAFRDVAVDGADNTGGHSASGLPIAITVSPTRNLSLSPKATAGRFAPVTRSNATSARPVMPRTSARKRAPLLGPDINPDGIGDHVAVGGDQA
jgi:hypothetical protein